MSIKAENRFHSTIYFSTSEDISYEVLNVAVASRVAEFHLGTRLQPSQVQTARDWILR